MLTVRATALVALLAVHTPVVQAQSTRGAPYGGAMDDHFRRDAARGEGLPSRAFAFAVRADAAVAIARVDEQRQARGNPRFILTLTNRAESTVRSFEIVALVVGENGQVTAVHPLPAVKGLKRGQIKHHEVELRGVTLATAERLAFVVAKVDGDGDGVEAWSAPEAELRGMAAEAAALMFPRQ